MLDLGAAPLVARQTASTPHSGAASRDGVFEFLLLVRIEPSSVSFATKLCDVGLVPLAHDGWVRSDRCPASIISNTTRLRIVVAEKCLTGRNS